MSLPFPHHSFLCVSHPKVLSQGRRWPRRQCLISSQLSLHDTINTYLVSCLFQDGSSGLEKPIFKRVAIVEYFFDIIYMVHVETEAKNGKHAGQKRTYRAVSIAIKLYFLFLVCGFVILTFPTMKFSDH